MSDNISGPRLVPLAPAEMSLFVSHVVTACRPWRSQSHPVTHVIAPPLIYQGTQNLKNTSLDILAKQTREQLPDHVRPRDADVSTVVNVDSRHQQHKEGITTCKRDTE